VNKKSPFKNTEPLKKKKRYLVSASQFGIAMGSDVIESKDRESAIRKFKKKNRFNRGYLIYARETKLF
jgi:hypothetical protein